VILSQEIENFQSHKKTRLEYHPGVNVIIGESDSGKTAIQRALDWALNNKPRGTAFRSNWGGDTSVLVSFKEGQTIQRLSTDSKNTYAIKDGSPIFKSFGVGVPEEIEKIINMNSVNWQRQMDPPFLLSESSGEVAKELNRTVHLEIIDSSLVAITMRSREIKREIKFNEDAKISIQENIQKYNHLEKMEKLICDLEDKEKRKETTNSDIATITETISEIKRRKEESEEYKKILLAENTMDEISSIRKKMNIYAGDISSLSHQIQLIKKTKKEISTNISLLGLDPLVGDHADVVRVCIRLVFIMTSISKHETENEELIEMIETLENKMPDTCPTCGQAWDGGPA